MVLGYSRVRCIMEARNLNPRLSSYWAQSLWVCGPLWSMILDIQSAQNNCPWPKTKRIGPLFRRLEGACDGFCLSSWVTACPIRCIGLASRNNAGAHQCAKDELSLNCRGTKKATIAKRRTVLGVRNSRTRRHV